MTADSATGVRDVAPQADLPLAETAADSGGEADTVPAPDDTSRDGALPEVDSAEEPATGCSRTDLAFVELPEVSGAAPLDEDHDLLVADSGHDGRALVVDRHGGTITRLDLPLGVGAGDDLEGLARGPDGLFYGLTSSGWLRVWRVELVADAWTASLERGPEAVSSSADWAAGPTDVNAGPNYEGLCLHPSPTPGDCAGWAASKASGELVCLRRVDGSLRIDPAVRAQVFPPDHLSDCAYEPTAPYRLFAAGNVFAEDRLHAIDLTAGVPTVAPGALETSGIVGAPNQEALLVRPASPPRIRLISFGDWQELGGDRSPQVTIDCVDSPRPSADF